MINWKVIILCLGYLFHQSYAWCKPEVDLDGLIRCLLRENIKVFDLTMTKFYKRLRCAKAANCIPKPWDAFTKNVQTVENFAKCMEEIEENIREIDMLTLHTEEYKCRRNLVENLPDSYNIYHVQIIPETQVIIEEIR